jgi:hypothetical protein
MLDCSNPDTAGLSLARIFRTNRRTLESACRKLHLDGSRRSLIPALFGPAPAPSGFSVAYFHATRVLPTRAAFSSGLVPLGTIVDDIWSDLYSFVRAECSPAEWDRFRRSVETDHPAPLANLYRMKTNAITLWGPFGFLIRDVAFQCPRPVRDYLSNPPEIVEDICTAYDETFGRNLVSEYLAATRPCFVKFYSPRSQRAVLEVAIEYLACSVQGVALHSNLAISFDGHGRPIPRKRILEVQLDPE